MKKEKEVVTKAFYCVDSILVEAPKTQYISNLTVFDLGVMKTFPKGFFVYRGDRNSLQPISIDCSELNYFEVFDLIVKESGFGFQSLKSNCQDIAFSLFGQKCDEGCFHFNLFLRWKNDHDFLI